MRSALRNYHSIVLMFSVVLLAACSSAPSADEQHATALNLAKTMVHQTSQAGEPSAAPALPSATFTATATPWPTETPTPVPTATELPATLTTNNRANCRNGPGLTYLVVVTLEEGETAFIEGRNGASSWWYVRTQDGSNCWIYGEIVTVQNAPEDLPTVEASPPPSGSRDPNYIYYYLILEDTGGPVACGDSLIAMNTGMLRTGDPAQDVVLALRALVSIGSPYVSGLRHAGYQSNLKVVSAEYTKYNMTVNVYLTGTVIKPDTNCDKERFRVQIFATAQQFEDVAKAYVWVGTVPIGDYLVPTKNG
ncbi:MAG: hypothetical protein OEZ02_08545 [Anaerolineae bacterium]|nr:hypothetical protein [Anaerolineae bacterium]